jgi:hypothetical protein
MTKPVLSQEQFEEILADIIYDEGEALLAVPGIYEAASEHFNNEVLDRWAVSLGFEDFEDMEASNEESEPEE